MADAAHVQTDVEIAKMQRRISRIYAQARRDITKDFSSYSKTIKKQADKLFEDIAKAETENDKKAAKMAYKRFFSVNVKQDKAFKKASETAANRLYSANNDAAAYINTKTANIYALNYNQIGRGLQKDLSGYEFKPVSEDDADKYGDIERQAVDEKKDTDWNRKNIVNSVIAGALLLYGVDKIFGNAIKTTINKNLSSANRQASDMATGAENKGRIDSMYRASDEGHGVKKFWIATKDNRTRESHIEYDGLDPQELDYEYNVGLKEPKDKNCTILAEVCNCRCSISYKPAGHGRSETMAAREGEVTGSYKQPKSFADTRTVHVQKMTYKEWMAWRSR